MGGTGANFNKNNNPIDDDKHIEEFGHSRNQFLDQDLAEGD